MASKKTERDQLESFLRSRPDLRLTTPVDLEEPDFLFTHGATRLGIELTQFSPWRDGSRFISEEQESLRNRVMNAARRIFESNSLISLHVDATFNDSHPLKQGRVADLAQEIADYLARNAVDAEIYAEIPFLAPENPGRLAEIAAINPFRVPERSYGAWCAGQAGWVSQAEEKHFTRILAQKERRLESYRRRCDEVWLVVVFDVTAGSDHVEGPRAPVEFQLKTGFDRIFSLDRIGDRCVEIPCRQPVAGNVRDLSATDR
jgi:hypothetical protein